MNLENTESPSFEQVGPAPRPVFHITPVPHENDPIRQGIKFVLHGHVYAVTGTKTRGRHTIRHLGLAR